MDGIRMCREVIAHLNWRKWGPVPDIEFEEPIHDPEDLLGLVSKDLKSPFDMREVISRIVDASSFEEFKPLYGPTLVCGWAKIHGYPIGILFFVMLHRHYLDAFIYLLDLSLQSLFNQLNGHFRHLLSPFVEYICKDLNDYLSNSCFWSQEDWGPKLAGRDGPISKVNLRMTLISLFFIKSVKRNKSTPSPNFEHGPNFASASQQKQKGQFKLNRPFKM